MRQGIGFILSFVFHASLVAFALYWAGGQDVRVNMDRPVYTVDLISLAPPPGPSPEVEAVAVPGEATPEAAPTVEAAAEAVAEIKPVPVVEARPEPEVKDISPKKVEKTTIKKKEEPKPEPKPKPKPKPQKTAEQMLAEGLAAAKAEAAKQAQARERQKNKAIASELAALKKREGEDVYAHGGQPGGQADGQAGGVQGGAGSGLSEVYALIVGSAIKKHWRYPSFAGEANLIVTIEMVLDAEGKIISSKVIQSSNNPEFDSSALRAIKETEYVERPKTDRDRVIRINFNSQELSE
jgi:colicin import membrane protein